MLLTPRRSISCATLAVGLALALAGCGGGNSSDSGRSARVAGTTADWASLAASGAASGRLAHSAARGAVGVAALAATTDGARVLMVDRPAARIRLLQRADGRVLREWAWPAELGPSTIAPGSHWLAAALAVSSDAGTLLVARRDSTVVAYVLDGAGARQQVWRGHAQPVRSVALSGNGLRAASGGDDARVLWWDVPGGRLLRVVASGSGIVDALALSADGAWLATGGADGQVRVWDAGADRLVAQFDARAGAVRALAFGGGAAWLASATADGAVTVWDVSRRSAVHRLAGPAAVTALGFADPAASVLVAGTEDGRLLSWPLGAGAGR
jgi:WD40 repeat protein